MRANAIITRPTSMTLIDDPAEGAGCWAGLRRCPVSIDDGEVDDWNGSRGSIAMVLSLSLSPLQ